MTETSTLPDQNRPLVSILVVAFNSRNYIDACLSSVPGACGEFAYQVLLVDNGTDQTSTLVQEVHPHVQVLPTRGNVGFGEANNRLAQHTDPGSQYLVLLNPDTRLHTDAITALVKAARDHPEYAALGGHMETPAGGPSAASSVVLPTVSRMALGAIGLADWAAARRRLPDAHMPVRQVEAVSGGFMLIRREAWERLRGFDESFFLYGEDVDLCHRISAAGMKIGSVSSARVHHDVGSGDYFSPVRTRYLIVANAHFANRHFGLVRRTAFKAALWLRCWVRFGLGAVLAKPGSRLDVMAKAYRDSALNPRGWMSGFDSPSADPRRRKT